MIKDKPFEPVNVRSMQKAHSREYRCCRSRRVDLIFNLFSPTLQKSQGKLKPRLLRKNLDDDISCTTDTVWRQASSHPSRLRRQTCSISLNVYSDVFPMSFTTRTADRRQQTCYSSPIGEVGAHSGEPTSKPSRVGRLVRLATPTLGNAWST